MRHIIIGEYRYRIFQTLSDSYQIEFAFRNPFLRLLFGWDNLGRSQSLENATEYMCTLLKKSTVYRNK